MRIDAHAYDRSKPEDRIISPDLEKIEGSSRTDLFMDHELTQRSVRERVPDASGACVAKRQVCSVFFVLKRVF